MFTVAHEAVKPWSHVLGIGVSVDVAEIQLFGRRRQIEVHGIAPGSTRDVPRCLGTKAAAKWLGLWFLCLHRVDRLVG
jgi:hypothetical protein